VATHDVRINFATRTLQHVDIIVSRPGVNQFAGPFDFIAMGPTA
jgi:methylmalonyl-CoA mutase cobalamin-binding subunit